MALNSQMGITRRAKSKTESWSYITLQQSSNLSSNPINKTSSRSQESARHQRIWLEAAVHYFERNNSSFKQIITRRIRKEIRRKRKRTKAKKRCFFLSQRVSFRRQFRRLWSKATTYTPMDKRQKHRPSQMKLRRKKRRTKGVDWVLIDSQLKR